MNDAMVRISVIKSPGTKKMKTWPGTKHLVNPTRSPKDAQLVLNTIVFFLAAGMEHNA